jgi:dTDP-N-acetylfucosamine:lipid II N-acetylfucosaminyltransferase
MLLHLVHDDKFIDSAIDLFERIHPGRNKFIVGVQDENHQLKYIKRDKDVCVAAYKSVDYDRCIGDFSQYEAVFFHYLDKPKLEILKKIRTNATLAWISWGSDIYSRLPERKYRLYGPEEKRVLAEIRSRSKAETILRRSALFAAAGDILAEIRLLSVRRALKKISYFSTVIPEEKQIVQKFFRIQAEHVRFTYDLRTQDIQSRIRNRPVRKNILLGNSASPANNHIEMINALSKTNLDGMQVLVPLSYGGNMGYIRHIQALGKAKLGDRFVPLLTFLDTEKYYDILSECSVCIMNHYRQQGLGNISFMLFNGAKVFLNESNLAYPYYKNNGIAVFSIEHDLFKSADAAVSNDLPESVIENNRKIMGTILTHEIIQERANVFVATILGGR